MGLEIMTGPNGAQGNVSREVSFEIQAPEFEGQDWLSLCEVQIDSKRLKGFMGFQLETPSPVSAGPSPSKYACIWALQAVACTWLEGAVRRGDGGGEGF